MRSSGSEPTRIQARVASGPVHDVLLFYSKSKTYSWNQLYAPYSAEYLEKYFRNEDSLYAAGDKPAHLWFHSGQKARAA